LFFGFFVFTGKYFILRKLVKNVGWIKKSVKFFRRIPSRGAGYKFIAIFVGSLLNELGFVFIGV
jgi:hypothetical protein